MKAKALNLLLILTSLVGYLEWGTGNHTFLLQAEVDLLAKIFSDPLSVLHPFTILPLVGQLILIATLFQSTPDKWLSWIGMACIALLLVFIALVGLLSLKFTIFISTLPFLITAVITVIHHRRKA